MLYLETQLPQTLTHYFTHAFTHESVPRPKHSTAGWPFSWLAPPEYPPCNLHGSAQWPHGAEQSCPKNTAHTLKSLNIKY